MKKILFAFVLTSAIFTQAAVLTYEPENLQIEGVNLNRTDAINDAAGVAATTKLDLLD